MQTALRPNRRSQRAPIMPLMPWPGAKMLCRLNCVGGGSAVKNCPLNATPKMETGTFELMNNCPVKDAVNSGNRKTAPSQTANVAVVLRRLSFSR